MKKNLEKIFAPCSIVVAIILIMVLVVTAFGGIEATEFESKLVQGLIVTLAILYLVLAVVSLVLIFVNSDVVKEITLRQEKGGSVRVSANVVTKLVKQTCKQVEGVKCKKVALVSDEYGVRLKVNVKVNVKVVDKDVIEAETYLRTLLEDVFLGEFGFKFSSIEIKVMALTPKYKADQAAVQAKVEKKLEEMNAQEAKSGSANETENVEEIVTEDTSAETEEAQEEAQDCADAQCDETQDESAEEVADDANEDVESESAEENQSEEETATENEAE